MTWDTNSLWIMLALGVIGLPLVIRILEMLTETLTTQLQNACDTARQWTPKIWAWAAARVTHGRSIDKAIRRMAGDVCLVAAGAMIGYSEWLLALATLGPLFGVSGSGEVAEMPWLLGCSLVVSGMVFFAVMSDLTLWTDLTLFADIKRGREATYKKARRYFWATLGVAVLMAIYRSLILMFDQLMDWGVNPLWLEVMGMGILLPLAAIYMLAMAFCFVALDGLFTTLTAICVALVGAAVGLLGWVLHLASVISGWVNQLFTLLREYWEACRDWIVTKCHNGQEARKVRKAQPKPVTLLVELEENSRSGQSIPNSPNHSTPTAKNNPDTQGKEKNQQNGYPQPRFPRRTNVHAGAWN